MESTPVFVKVDAYKDVLEAIGLIKTKINDAKGILNEISDLKHEEDSELENWNNSLADVEGKIESIDKALFEPESL